MVDMNTTQQQGKHGNLQPFVVGCGLLRGGLWSGGVHGPGCEWCKEHGVHMGGTKGVMGVEEVDGNKCGREKAEEGVQGRLSTWLLLVLLARH